MSWLGGGVGWVLAERRCSNGKWCAGLYRTTDGGAVWRHEPTPRTVVRRQSVVNGVAFTSQRVGYLYGDALWVTRDGARTWRRIPGPSTTALAIAGRTTYRLASWHSGCPGPCRPMIQRAVTGTGSWRTLYRSRRLASFGFGGSLSASGRQVFATFYGHPAGGAPDAHATYIESSDGGTTWVQRHDACGGHDQSERDTSVVTVTGTHVTLACQRRLPPQTATVLQSNTAGQTFTAPDPLPFAPTAIARTGRWLLIGAASTENTFLVALSKDRGQHWRRVLTERAQPSDWDEGTTNLQCVKNQCAYLGDPRHVFVSLNHGQTWRSHRI